MSEEQLNIAQHTPGLLRRMDTRLDDVLLRLSLLERRGALKDAEVTPGRLGVVKLRQRMEPIELRLDLTN